MRLKALNMRFEDQVFTLERMRYGSRTLVDPWGTVIELTQGLRGY